MKPFCKTVCYRKCHATDQSILDQYKVFKRQSYQGPETTFVKNICVLAAMSRGPIPIGLFRTRRPFKEPRNRFLAWRVRQTYLLYRTASLHMLAESFLGIHSWAQ
jgi:hypothetical protein